VTFSKPPRKSFLGILACAALVGGLMLSAKPAAAGWRGGVWIGVPAVGVVPPVYPYAYYPPAYYPPAYYPPAYYPPPVAYAPPAATPIPPGQTSENGQVAYGATCYAGVYVCQAPGNTAVGAGCSCPGLGAPSYGTVH
jgi:hypothetical protein